MMDLKKHQELMNKIKYLRAGLLLALILLNSACDFTPRIHQQILIAQTYITNQEYTKAVKQYHEILEEIPPQDIRIKIYYQLGELYAISLGEYRKGIHYYEKIRELTNDPIWLVKTQERVGEIAYTYIKDYKKSEDIYKELISFRPKLNNYDLYEYRYVSTLVNQNKFIEAEKNLVPLQNSPNHKFHTDAFYLYGQLYFHNKDWQKSVSYLREYIKREKRRDKIVKAKFLMGNAYETMERLKLAYNIYYSILGEYPNTKVIQQRLKSVYERRISRRR